MTYYFIIYNRIQPYITEYIVSISNKISYSKIIIFPDEPIPQIESDDVYVFVGIHYVMYPLIDLPNVYYINLEQMTIDGSNSPKNLLGDLLDFKFNSSYLNLLDYSAGNVSILDQNYIESQYIPYQVNYEEIFDHEKELDFVLCCTVNERKLKIYNQLNLPYPKSKFIGNPPIWGSARDEILFRSKILVNIHHTEKDYDLVEEIRITRCILNKIIVISEPAKYSEKYPLNSYIIYETYDLIVDKVKHVLENYDFYYGKIYGDLDIEIINANLKSYLQVLPQFEAVNSLIGFSDMYSNQILKFNSVIKNTNLTNAFKTFRTQTKLFGHLDSGDTPPDQTAISISDKINTELLGKYLDHNIQQNIVGYDLVPAYGKLTNSDTKYIMLSVILFTQLKQKNFDKIIEIGGGFGNMLRLNHCIQNFKTWKIIDYLHMNLLQEYYLSTEHVPKNKYILTPNNTNVNSREKSDIVISIYSLSEYSMKDFMIYYENIISNAKYFFYVFNKGYPSTQLNDAKINIISQDFNLLNDDNSQNNPVCVYLYANNMSEAK
jgi:hypothetical protein